MTDDWSLKGNSTLILETKVYYPEMIETLRRKLIEDVEELNIRMRHSDTRMDTESLYKDDITELILGLRKQINKRFGVEG